VTDLHASFARPSRSSNRRGACDLLHDLLSDGAIKSLDVYATADHAGVKRATLRRAATKLGVERRRDGERGPWLMTLPDSVPAQIERTCSPERLEHVRHSVSTYGRNGSKSDAEPVAVDRVLRLFADGGQTKDL
jgi:hypothetical protein